MSMTAHPHPGPASRIVTLTMNPALDITTETDWVRHTDKIRCGPARHDPGGGGINVARVAAVLGASVSAVYPRGGLTGARIARLLDREGVPQRPIDVAESNRENVTVNETSTRKQYRFVLPGPRLTVAEQDACLESLREAANGADVVVASGSLPPGTAEGFHQNVSELCRDAGALFILDTSGGGLAGLRSGVHLLKPSLRELRDYAGRPLYTEAEQFEAAHEIVDRGCATSVLVSRGGGAALLATPNRSERFSSHDVAKGSGVGAGDALVAGIAAGLSRAWSLPDSIRLGMAAGAAMLSTPGTATCRPQDVWALLAGTEQPITVGESS